MRGDDGSHLSAGEWEADAVMALNSGKDGTYAMVDFSKRLGNKDTSKQLDPVAIYDTLDRASDKGPLRPAQTAILTDWHQKHRSQRDLIVKLHTGQGKTLIGLLLLQSKLNETGQPAVYVCPNRFLVNQTCGQAKQFGVPFCVDEGDFQQEFILGRKMLITHVQKVFNGQTRFRMGPKSLSIATFLMDDSHACADSIRDSSVIRLERKEPAYTKIVELFAKALEQQGAGTFQDVLNGNYDALLPVPYWAWHDRQAEVVAILADVAKAPVQNQKPHSAWFTWPLIKDNLANCQCVVSGQSLEIAPYLPPLDLYGSYYNAKHRVFMSATVTNDAFLIKGLRLSPETVRNPLVYKDEKWSGEKMILVPALIDDSLDRSAIVNVFGKKVPKRKYGVVALTPSFKRTTDWEACGAVVAKTETIDNEINRLRAGDCEAPLAIASRYDGIDLPDDSCRILVFDSQPHAANLIDSYTDSCRAFSAAMTIRTARTIEQGLGRSVRGEKDYCVIIMIGPELVRMIRSADTREYLSNQTRAQIDIGLEIAEMAKGEISTSDPAMNVLIGLVNQCLKRDTNWKQFYVERMDAIGSSAANSETLDMFQQELEAELAYESGNPRGAVKLLQELLDKQVKDDGDRGWYLQEIARYAHAYSKTDSNALQLHAHRKNRYVMRPQTGMQIDKLMVVGQKRAANIIEWARSFGSYEELHLAVEDILGRLDFGVKADRFEQACDQLGRALGFGSQRPDKEWKEGPDNLWAVRDGEYFLIEGKSEVDLKRAEINKDESGQMNNACAWFANNYPGAKVMRFMIIPTKRVSKAAGFIEEVLILRASGLAKLTRCVKRFFAEFATLDLKDVSEAKVQQLIDAHGLGVDSFCTSFLEKAVQL